MSALILFAILFALFIISVPIAIALGLASVLFLIIMSDIPLITLPQRLFASLDSFPLMAAPFFILAGKLMEHGGISERLVDFAKSLVGQVKGGLAHVGIIGCMFFAAISGSASATTAAIGSILIPAMVKAGYDRNFATAVHAAGGTTGIIIPPSVPMVLYGVAAGASVSSLFIAGILPGIMIGLSLIAYTFFVAGRRGYGRDLEKTSLKKIWQSFKKAGLAIIMPVIILGGIYGGYFTPTEASVVAVVYGFIVGTFVYKQIKWKEMREILVSSVVTTSVILLIIGTAGLFGMVLTREQVPQNVANFISGMDASPVIILLIINLLLLIVGTFMETIAAIIILTPILLPLATSIDLDPVHFGVIMIVNLSIGLITPPVGVNLFVGARIGNTTFEGLARAILPFIIILIVNVLIISYVPSISLGLLK